MKELKTISDEKLLRQIQSGNDDAMECLLERYRDMVRKEARSFFLAGGDEEDLIQEGMIGLFKAVQSYQPDKDASFRTFAGMCLDRQLYSAIQNSNRQKHMPLNSYISLSEEPEETDELEGSWWENPENIIIDQESTRSLEQEIHRALSSMENRVLEYYLKGYGHIQIAKIMGKTPKSIDNALQRIRGKIRNFSLSFWDKK